MAFYSGQANSYSELLNFLIVACTNHGWTFSSNVLTKNGKSIKLEIQKNVETAGTVGPGILLKIAADAYPPRFGLKRLNQGSITWPMDYKIFIFTDVDEVYLVGKYSNQFYLWLAFGVSSLVGTQGLTGSGFWCGAHSSTSAHSSASWGVNASFNPDVDSTDSDYTTAMLFGGRAGSAKNWAIDLSTSGGFLLSGVNAIRYSIPLYQRSINNWSQNINLIPINVYATVASSKVSLLAEIQNARYVRLDNYEPEQIISYGTDRWMVFPWWRKFITSTGEGFVDNTGTMGWAIRYDGP